MSDYEFRCPECKKINCNHSTGDAPKLGGEVECISCGRISIVEYVTSTLEVAMSNKKNYPSKLDALDNSHEKKGCGEYVEEKQSKGFIGYVCGDIYKGIYKLCNECVKRNKEVKRE